MNKINKQMNEIISLLQDKFLISESKKLIKKANVKNIKELDELCEIVKLYQKHYLEIKKEYPLMAKSILYLVAPTSGVNPETPNGIYIRGS